MNTKIKNYNKLLSNMIFMRIEELYKYNSSIYYIKINTHTEIIIGNDYCGGIYKNINNIKNKSFEQLLDNIFLLGYCPIDNIGLNLPLYIQYFIDLYHPDYGFINHNDNFCNVINKHFLNDKINNNGNKYIELLNYVLLNIKHDYTKTLILRIIHLSEHCKNNNQCCNLYNI